MPPDESLDMLANEFDRAALTARRDIEVVSQAFGQKLVDAVKRYASGRPGPRVITGEYLDSIFWEMDSSAGLPSLNVGSTAPQTMRLEMGFSGTDALGRRFDQPPYPHFRPAADEMEPAYEEALAVVADLDFHRGAI